MSASGTVIVVLLLSFLMFAFAGDKVPGALANFAPLRTAP